MNIIWISLLPPLLSKMCHNYLKITSIILLVCGTSHKRLLNLSNLYATTSSIIFHVPASRVSFRSDIHVEHTQLPTIGIAENESSLRRSLSLRALGVHLSTHGCVHSKRRGDLSAAAYVTRRPHLGPLGVNKPRFDIACHEIPFVWLSRERMRIVIMRARVRVEHARLSSAISYSTHRGSVSTTIRISHHWTLG